MVKFGYQNLHLNNNNYYWYYYYYCYYYCNKNNTFSQNLIIISCSIIPSKVTDLTWTICKKNNKKPKTKEYPECALKDKKDNVITHSNNCREAVHCKNIPSAMKSDVFKCMLMQNSWQWKTIFIVLEQQHLLLCLINAQEYMLIWSDLGLMCLTELRGHDTLFNKNALQQLYNPAFRLNHSCKGKQTDWYWFIYNRVRVRVRSFSVVEKKSLMRRHAWLRTPPKCLLRLELKDSQESQTKEGSRWNCSCRHITSHKHQLRFIRSRKGHLKKHQRRLPVPRTLLSILHIPVCYLSC